jgi:ABC-type glycerol-3-phosphate transport system substrate-binding protein
MQTSNFQIIVLGICTALIVVGVGVFASFGGFLGGKNVGKVIIWGTIDSDAIGSVINELGLQDKTFQDVTYVEKNPAKYETELINAMANGTAPDLFIASSEDILDFSDKILTIPYSNFSQSLFLSSFIDQSQVFLNKNGSLALPLTVDPLVMYWNRDLFASAGIASPPQYWNDFITLAPKITSIERGSSVKKSAVALGEWRNIAHAKDILAALFMQAGDPIITRGDTGLSVVLGTTPAGFKEAPAESALRFYTEFANPSKTSYSWNRALPFSTNAFVAGDLAAYFGFASENASLAQRNPNLRFGMALLPQISKTATRMTYGQMTGLSIPRTAKNPSGALVIARGLTGKIASSLLSQALGLPSPRRDVSPDTSNNASAAVMSQSALIARSWLDPNPSATDALFQTMIESVISGKAQPAQAVGDASRELAQIISGN